MPDLLPGTPIVALDTPPTPISVQGTTITTTSATFVASGADCVVTFTAPTSGRVKLYTTARMINSATSSGALIAPETRVGAVTGVGTVFEPASDGNAAANYGNTFARSTTVHLLTGLTPGTVYNTRLLVRSSGAGDTASFANRELFAEAAF